MKCTQCGSKKLVETYCPFSTESCKGLDTYICFDCGHYEYFSMEDVDYCKKRIEHCKELEKKIKEFPKKIKELENEISDLQKKLTEKQSLRKKLGDDITISQQAELGTEITMTKTSIPSKLYEKRMLEEEIIRLKWELEHDRYRKYL